LRTAVVVASGALSAPPSFFCSAVEQPTRKPVCKITTVARIRRETRQGPRLCIETDPLHPKASRIRPRGPLSPSAGGGSAVQPQLSASLFDYVPLNDAPPFHGPPSPSDGPTKSDRLVNFEDGLCEAKQEAQYGNLAIFRRGQRFFEILRWIKANRPLPIMRPISGDAPQSGDLWDEIKVS
jgi:hypothetical protein